MDTRVLECSFSSDMVFSDNTDSFRNIPFVKHVHRGINSMGRHLAYLKYVLRHKWYVFIACCKLGQVWRGIMHDMSKFLPDEWFAYANYFYNSNGSPRTKDSPESSAAFQLAWLKHQHRNPHHWQHWVLREDSGLTLVLPMPLKYVKEMVADWRGAGKAINGKDDVIKWYAYNRGQMLLAKETRTYMEELISEKRGEIC